jgi:flagellar L-ring protein precursor FlgH
MALFAGCASLGGGEEVVIPEPTLPPAGITAVQPNPATEGSLWVHGVSENLWTDTTARRLHDIVFVDVVETANATTSADTDTSRDASLLYAIPNLLGFENEINTIADDEAGELDGVNLANLVNASTANEFESETETLRNTRMTARISAQVVEVYPNGNLRLYGSQVVSVNNERQLMTVTGLARPHDIGANNTISSMRLAEARVELTGRGVLSDHQRPGWGTRVLAWVWPF